MAKDSTIPMLSRCNPYVIPISLVFQVFPFGFDTAAFVCIPGEALGPFPPAAQM